MTGALAGRVALVTGASSDIGRAVVAALATEGARLVLAGRDRNRLAVAAAGSGRSPVVVRGDLTTSRGAADLTRAVLDRCPEGLDLLVHAAGAYAHGPVEMASTAELDRLYRVNVRAPLEITRSLLPALRQRRGQVVFVNSTQGLTASGEVGPYAATRHAARGLADSLRAEVNVTGIRVLSLHVGTTATELTEKRFRELGRAYHPELLLQPADVARTLVSCVTLPPTAEVTSLALRPTIKTI